MSLFLNLGLLAGLAGVAVPAVIHLLNKSRYRVLRWGAMIFLGDLASKKRRSINLQQILLLLVRMLVIACFVLALARPVLRAPSVILGGSRTAVILLDCSYSMGARKGAGDRFEEAKAFALDVVEGLERGDRAAVVLLGGGGRPECPQFDADLERAAAQIRDARLAHGRADAVAALECALERFAASGDTVGREIYLITDSQKASWPDSSLAGDAASGLERIAAALEESAFRPEVFLVGVEGEADNAAVRGMEIESPVLQAGRPTPVAVTVANYGGDPCETIVKLAADGELVGVRTVRLQPGLTEAVRFVHVFDEPGSHLLEAEIRPDALAADDRAARSVEVLDRLPVLLVNGDPHPEMLRGECGFLRLALEPVRHAAGVVTPAAGPSAGEGRDLFAVTEVGPGELAKVEYSRFRAVALANVPVIAEADLARLEDFVSQGGGLLMAPGDMVRPEGFNTLFWRRGDGVSPAGLETPVGDGGPPETPAPLTAGHPLFGFLSQGKARPGIGVRRRFSIKMQAGKMQAGKMQAGKTQAGKMQAGKMQAGKMQAGKMEAGRMEAGHSPPGAAARRKTEKDESGTEGARTPGVLMRTTAGDPLLIERPFGKGRVLLTALPLDDDWSDLPTTAFYVPFVWSAFGYLAGDAFPPRNVSVGESLATWVESADEVSEAVMYPAGGEPLRLEVKRRGGRDAVSYDDTDRPGVYTLRLRRGRGEEAVHFVVRVPREESDIRPLPDSEREIIEERLATEFVTTREELRGRISQIRRGSELWRPLLLLAVALACLEVFVAARWHTVAGLANRRGP